MLEYPKQLTTLINRLSKLPGVGRRSAQRLAFYLMELPEENSSALIAAIEDARHGMVKCEVCGGLSETTPCPICASCQRDHGVICVVSEARDVFVLENMHGYNGVYHVLGGVLSPLDGIGPDELNIRSLVTRINEGDVNELIVATNADVAGEATASYISGLAHDKKIKASRLAFGIPIGGSLEYIDAQTLNLAIEGRREF